MFPVLKALEITLAVASGLCGAGTAVLAGMRRPVAAAITGGIGLAVCNVIWVLRLVHPS